MRRPDCKLAWNSGQLILGVQLDYGRIVPVRWFVLHVGPVSLAISAGRRDDGMGDDLVMALLYAVALALWATFLVVGLTR